MEINGQKIVLTGAASGIGRALLDQLSKYNTTIMAADVEKDNLDKALDALETAEARILPFNGDLSEQSEIDRLFEYAQQEMGGVSLFFANAGFAYYEKIESPEYARLEKIFQINVLSPIYSTEKMKSINPEGKYKVVITASSIGLLAIPGFTLYASTKAALHRFAEGYRFELENPSMLTLVYPISTNTGFAKRASHRAIPMPWPVQSADQVAKSIIRGVLQDKKSIYPSTLFRIVIFCDRFQPYLRKLIQAINLYTFKKWLA
jgi:short-subunit dehydrogenase